MPRHPQSNQTESARTKKPTPTHYYSKTTSTGCWQRPDKQSKLSTKYYVRKVSTTNYHILPLIDDNPNCTTKGCIPKETAARPHQRERVNPTRTRTPQQKPNELDSIPILRRCKKKATAAIP